ncbi:unnamed protein product [Rhodiola kirilowii]
MTKAETLHDQKNLEKQMGCMAGFLQLFDRQHLLTGKRIYSTKRLPPPPSIADSASESVRSPPKSKEPETTSPASDRSSPANEIRSKAQLETSIMTTPPMAVFEIKEGTRSSWKFREAPRLSLDSRATTDANGTLRPKQIRTTNQSGGDDDDMEKQRKSTGVIARLMGLEPLPPSSVPQLRRSASESRVTRDLSQSSNYQHKSITTPHPPTGVPVRENASQELAARPAKCQPVRSAHRRNFYDSADFFPEPKQTAVTVYGEIEKRLKMSGIDGSSKDLETLKHILEALQLKGLLHSNKYMDQTGQRNFVYEREIEPPIVVMKPSRSPFNGNESPPPRYRSRPARPNASESLLPSASPRRQRFDCDGSPRENGRMRNSISPTRSESTNLSVPTRKQFNVDTSRSQNASPERRRVSSPVNSPKPSFRRSVPNQASSPRNRKSSIDTDHPPFSDESSSISEGCISNSSQSDSQRVSRSDGKSLLSRCDELLQSIADMNSTNAPQQPSPISVLDPSFYKEDESSSSSPSPVLKRSIDFKDLPVDLDDEVSSWTSSAISTVDGSSSDDSDFLYVADVLRALACLPEEPNVFPLLEKQQCKKGKDASKTSRLNRKLIFDNVSEILDKKRQLPPWKAISVPDLCTDAPSLPHVWSEFKKTRERDESDQELFQVICGVLKKDLEADSFNGWGEWQMEVADSVLDIERMIFKDIIGESIRDLASSAVLFYPRRKLAF